MGWEFAALLIGALLLGIVMSGWQSRLYGAGLTALAKAHAGKQLRLVSGRSKGRLRGAVVALIVDPTGDAVVDARVMAGSTVFSRFKPAPELVGPIAEVDQRARDSRVREAVAQALSMVKPVATAQASSGSASGWKRKELK